MDIAVESDRWFRQFWLHAAMLALMLGALSFVLNNGSIAIVDEGVYSAQASALSGGSWSTPQYLKNVDPTGVHNALIGPTVADGRVIAYAHHPAYPLTLAPIVHVGGYQAMLLMSALGSWVAAVAAGLIARRINPRIDVVGLWLAGIGTPLLFYSAVVLGHSWAAALSGLLALCLINAWGLGASDATRSGFRALAWTTVAVMATVPLVLIRSEGTLVAGAMAASGVLLSVHLVHRRPRIDGVRLCSAIVVGLVAGLTYMMNGRWAGSLTAGRLGASGESDRITDPFAQAWVSLLRPWSDTRFASTAMALVLACCLLAVVTLRLLPRRPVYAVSLLCMAAAASLIRQFENLDLVTGFFAASPVLTVGLLLTGRRQFTSQICQFAIAASLITSAGILWLSYGVGGATEWGGRFFVVLVPILVPVAVAAMASAGQRMSANYRRVCAAALAVLCVSTGVLAIRTIDDLRWFNKEVVDSTLKISEGMPDGTLVAVATVNASGITRFFWDKAPQGFPIVNGGNLATFAGMLPDIYADGRREVLIITDTAPINVDYVLDKVQARNDTEPRWAVSDAQPLGASGLAALTVRPD